MPRRVVSIRSRGDGGLSLGRGWLKATGAILGVALPLGAGAAWMIKTSTANAILMSGKEIERTQQDFAKTNSAMAVELRLLKESVQQSSGQTQLDLAGLRQALREHGEAIAELKSAREIERRFHNERR